ncbi:MAG: O-antigen ligase family protein [Candidatus Levybacteria bacterium]|nr:O-antigen ligase family protein [Candidatus Levybacteria bacterium]
MASYLLFFLLFLLPFVIIPIGVSPFETPKVLLAELAIEALLLLTLFKAQIPKGHVKLSFFPFILLMMLILAGLHLDFFPSFQTVFGNAYRLQGVFLFMNLLIFAYISQRVRLPHIPPYFFIGFLLAHLLLAVILGSSDSQRAYGALGEPNALAATAVFLWPFSLFTPKNKYSLLLKTSGFCIAALLVIISGSRAGFIAIALQSAFLLISKKLPVSLSGALAVLVLLLSMFLPFVEKSGVYENRAEIWQTAIKAGFEYPIFGGGMGNIEIRLKDAATSLSNAIRFQYVDSSHNIFLDWWVQGGIFGFSLFVLLVGGAFYFAIKQKKSFEIVLLLGMIAVLSFNPASVVILIALWWTIGQCYIKESYPK